MARFINHEEGFGFDADDYLIPLNQDNYWVWLHRDEPHYDMAQVEDDRDGLSWYWHRWDVGDETFNQLDMMARKVGCVVLRSEANDQIKQIFDNKHQVNDDELDQLLGSEDEPRD